MKKFRFHPELFDARTEVLMLLELDGLELFWDFKAVDVNHEDYGLDVEGITSKDVAKKIAKTLRDWFPKWRYLRGRRYRGEWCVSIWRRKTRYERGF